MLGNLLKQDGASSKTGALLGVVLVAVTILLLGVVAVAVIWTAQGELTPQLLLDNSHKIGAALAGLGVMLERVGKMYSADRESKASMKAAEAPTAEEAPAES